MIIYLARNRANGKAYVGKTKRTLRERLSEHVWDADKGDMLPFHCALRKYGIEGFDIDILEECSTLEELNTAEIRLIAELGTHISLGKGYNCTFGGDGGSLPGRIVSEETRAKMAKSAKKRYDAGHGAFMRSRRKRGAEHAFAGKSWGRKGPLTEEAKKKISDYRRGRSLSEEHKHAISEAGKGRTSPKQGTIWSDEERTKHSVIRYFKKKPVFGYDQAGTCVVAYLSVEDAAMETGLGYRVLTGNRKKYGPKYVNGVTYRKSDFTIAELKKSNGVK